MLKTYTYPQFEYVRPPEVTERRRGHYPVVVVGAGPVGLSMAIDLAIQGQSVLVLDQATGQYVQKEMNLTLDPTTGQYVPVMTEAEAKAATNLNLTVHDDQGRLVCSDTDISHIAYCGWTPAAGGSFTLRVDNKGPSDAPYALMTN